MPNMFRKWIRRRNKRLYNEGYVYAVKRVAERGDIVRTIQNMRMSEGHWEPYEDLGVMDACDDIVKLYYMIKGEQL